MKIQTKALVARNLQNNGIFINNISSNATIRITKNLFPAYELNIEDHTHHNNNTSINNIVNKYHGQRFADFWKKN